jgi:nucleoside-diphosphate-sugar epimerase
LYKGSEKHLRSFTYVQDIIDGIMSVIGKEAACHGEIFNLGTEEENSTATGIETVENVLQKNIEIEEYPPRPGDQNRTKANIDKARRILGYDPRTTLKEGIEAQVKWFQESF